VVSSVALVALGELPLPLRLAQLTFGLSLLLSLVADIV